MSNDWIDEEGFRANVGIILTDDAGKLLLGGRVSNKGWQFPQGGMLVGEDPTAAMYRELREEVGLTPLCMIVGTDAFAHLHTWRDWEQLIELAHIVVVHRPGSDCPKDVPANERLKKVKTDKIKDLHDSPAGCFMSISIPMLEISSTQIRSILHNGQNPKYLLPESVLKIITEQNLYNGIGKT